MKTDSYNPSRLEVEFADALAELKDQLQEKLSVFEITHIEKQTKLDNPIVNFELKDSDGDKHQVVIRIIQKADNLH